MAILDIQFKIFWFIIPWFNILDTHAMEGLEIHDTHEIVMIDIRASND